MMRILQKLFTIAVEKLPMSKEVPVDTSHPANSQVRGYLEANAQERSKTALNYHVEPYEMMAHQDLYDRLHELGKGLPENCDGMIYGYPVLVNPRGGVIFALADGYNVIAIRLPEEARKGALASGAQTTRHFEGGFGLPPSVLHAETYGKEWVIIAPWGSDDQITSWLRTAYEYANELAKGTDEYP